MVDGGEPNSEFLSAINFRDIHLRACGVAAYQSLHATGVHPEIAVSIPARNWLAAFTLAAAMHGAAFAVAGRSTHDDLERGIGSPNLDIGSVSLVSLDGQSNLVEEIESESSEVSPDTADPVQESLEAEQTPQDVAAPSETAPSEIEPISEQAVALAVPVEMMTKPLESIEPKKKVPERPVRKKKKKKASKKRQSASVRKGGGNKGRKSNTAGTAALSSYKGRVRARVAGRARSPGGSGRVVVRFTVTASGGVSAARVVSGSSAQLNSAALRAVRGGFPPIPPGLPRSISFTLPIQFR